MIKNIKIKVSVPFVLLVATMYTLDAGNVFIPTFFAVIIHELSHVAAIFLCGASIDVVDIRAFGIRVNVPELSCMPYKKEIIIATAGPLAGIITASLGFAVAKILNTAIFDYFIGINVLITAINLIPVYPLDGGRIILGIVLQYLPVRVAYTISYILAIVSIGILLGLCTFLALRGTLNPSLVIFTAYIALCGIKAHHRI